MGFNIGGVEAGCTGHGDEMRSTVCCDDFPALLLLLLLLLLDHHRHHHHHLYFFLHHGLRRIGAWTQFLPFTFTKLIFRAVTTSRHNHWDGLGIGRSRRFWQIRQRDDALVVLLVTSHMSHESCSCGLCVRGSSCRANQSMKLICPLTYSLSPPRLFAPIRVIVTCTPH